MKKLKILVVDDEENILKSVSTFLEMSGHEAETAGKPSRALKKLERGDFDVLLTDFRMPEMNGLELADRVRERFPDLTWLLMTAFGSIKDAVEAMRKGAFDYLTKPVDGEELLAVLEKIASHRALLAEVKSLRRELGAVSPYPGLVGRSPAMQAVYEFIAKAAASELSVSLAGETGTGKSLVARAIHQQSSRASAPFVVVNCGALPETLLESELFGHQKGAFTGAVQERKGKILSADRGTLFLDEVATLSLPAQAKLLQALEEKQFHPLGSDRPVRADVRVIAATNEDLAGAVAAGKFRQDLYYRLQVLGCRLPPLRERKEDIPLLAGHFLNQISPEGIRVDPGAMNALLAHDWPGNVRELENVLKGAVAGSEKEVLSREDLPETVRGNHRPAGLTLGNGDSLKDKVAIFEQCLIEEALRRTRGNVTAAARELDFPLRSLKRKIDLYRIRPRDFSRPPGEK